MSVKISMKCVSLAAWILVFFFFFSCSAEAKIEESRQNSDITARQNEAVSRLGLGTALSLVLPIALFVALAALFAPLFTSLFAGFTGSTAPFLTAPPVYGRKRSLVSDVTQENIMQMLDTFTKAIENFTNTDEDKATPKQS